MGTKRQIETEIYRRLGQCSMSLLLVNWPGTAVYSAGTNMDKDRSEILAMADGLSAEEREKAAQELEQLAALLRKGGGTTTNASIWQSAPRSLRRRMRFF